MREVFGGPQVNNLDQAFTEDLKLLLITDN